MLNIVLVEPEIPQNCGNIARTCAATGSRLHLIRPLGFDISERAVRRAGLDYWHLVEVFDYENLDDFFEKRYRQIRSYEEYLYENSYRVVKIFLHVSKDEQKKRFLERIDRPEKNWKFSCSDLKERMRFDEYLDTFDEVITATATKHSPWYAIPADQKWYTRYLVSEIVLDALQKSCHEYPVLSDDAKAELLNCKAALEQE